MTATNELLAADAGVAAVHPFLDPVVVASVVRCYGVLGPADRAVALGDIFAHVAPEPLIARRTKASFDKAFFAGPSRAFVDAWTGGGVDVDLVDPRSFLLLQATWLARTELTHARMGEP